MEGYIKKMSHTHTEEYYSAIKRMKSCHLWNTDRPFSYIKWTKSDRKTNTMWFHIYV